MIEYHHTATPNDIMDLSNDPQQLLKPFRKKMMKLLYIGNKQSKRKLRKQFHS